MLKFCCRFWTNIAGFTMLDSRWSSVLRPKNTAAPAKSSLAENIETKQITKKGGTANHIQAKPKTKCHVTTWKRKESTVKTDDTEDLPCFKEQTKKPSKKRKTAVKKRKNVKPVWQQLLHDAKELEEYKIKVAKARELVAEDDCEEDNWLPFTVKKKSIQPAPPILDCKQLTLEEIKKYFEKNICLLMNIMSGEHYCKRHSDFKQKHLQNLDYLTVSFSMIAFSFEQVHKMANLMSECFDPENKKDEYFFKVLIPELCLKIFADVHNMSEEEAADYLKNRRSD